jgi:O-antigen ligase
MTMASSLAATARPGVTAPRLRAGLGAIALAACFIVCIWGPPTFKAPTEIEIRAPRDSMEGRLASYHFAQIAAWLGATAVLLVGWVRAAASDASPIPRYLLRGATGWFMAYGALACASVLWSPGPMLTGFRAWQIVVLQILVWLLSRHEERGPAWWHPIELLSWFCVANCVSTLVLYYFVDPSWVSVSTWDPESGMGRRVIGGGPFFRADCGLAGLVVFSYAVCGLLHGRRLARVRFGYLVLLALGAYSIYLMHTRTYLFGALATLLALLFFRVAPAFRPALVGGVAAVGAVVALFAQPVVSYVYRGQQSLVHMTGRTDWWPVYLEGVAEAPVFGSGFAVGGRYLGVLRQDDSLSSPHNAFLQTLLNLGVVGLVIAVVCLVLAARDGLRVLSGPSAGASRGLYAQAAALFFAVAIASIPSDAFATDAMTLDIVMFVAAITALRVVCVERPAEPSPAPARPPGFSPLSPRPLGPSTTPRCAAAPPRRAPAGGSRAGERRP